MVQLPSLEYTVIVPKETAFQMHSNKTALNGVDSRTCGTHLKPCFTYLLAFATQAVTDTITYIDLRLP